MLNNLRLSHESRLRYKSDFDRVFKYQKKIRCEIGIVRFTPNNQAIARIAIIASKRNVRLAVVRNRLRRLVKETFRHHQSSLQGLDIIFVAHREANTANKIEINRCLNKLFKRLAAHSHAS